LLSTLEVAAFFLATVYLPLADVITYYLPARFSSPRCRRSCCAKQVGWRRWTAIVIGFCGVLIALHPSPQTVKLAGADRARRQHLVRRAEC